MIVPDPETQGAPPRLEAGQIWACSSCFAKHEYYVAYDHGNPRAAARLLRGHHVRAAGEPRVDEWIPK